MYNKLLRGTLNVSPISFLKQNRYSFGLVSACAVCLLFWLFIEFHKYGGIPETYYRGDDKIYLLKMNFYNMWTWLDFGYYKRFSPFGYNLSSMLDRYLLSPLYGLNFYTSDIYANQLKPLYFMAITGLMLSVYALIYKLTKHCMTAVVASVAIGVNKGFFFFFSPLLCILQLDCFHPLTRSTPKSFQTSTVIKADNGSICLN